MNFNNSQSITDREMAVLALEVTTFVLVSLQNFMLNCLSISFHHLKINPENTAFKIIFQSIFLITLN